MFDLASAGEQWSHEARTELRYPASRIAEVTNRSGASSIVDSYHDDCNGPNAPKDAGALRTTLVRLDRSEYAVGDVPKFEVRIENIGSAPIEIPFSPHLADLQPEDASQKVRYLELSVDLWIGGVTWSANTASTVSFYMGLIRILTRC
jgi:hypothetical protein